MCCHTDICSKLTATTNRDAVFKWTSNHKHTVYSDECKKIITLCGYATTKKNLVMKSLHSNNYLNRDCYFCISIIQFSLIERKVSVTFIWKMLKARKKI